MNFDRFEELILLIVALLFLSYLFPFTIGGYLSVSVMIALLLILTLLLRSISWHHNRITPYDWVIAVGVLLTLAYISTFVAFTMSLLGIVLSLLFAGYHLLMAALLARHRGWLFGSDHRTGGAHHTREDADNAHQHRLVHAGGHAKTTRGKRFMRLLAPFKRHNPEFKEGMEPIPELHPDIETYDKED